MLTIKQMIATIEVEAKSAAPWTGKSEISPQVLAAMAAVARHEFVPANLQHSAYDNGPLPIGYGQTISQPYIVALMTDLLDVRSSDVVLEVGSGSGYQAAVLSRLAAKVYGMENISQLAIAARHRLRRLSYDNVEIIWGNGFNGLPQHAPFDAILVAAAPDEVPAALIEQLKPGGKMVVPVGGRYYGQDLKLLQKDERGRLSTRTVLPVAFVPLVNHTVGDRSVTA